MNVPTRSDYHFLLSAYVCIAQKLVSQNFFHLWIRLTSKVVVPPYCHVLESTFISFQICHHFSSDLKNGSAKSNRVSESFSRELCDLKAR